MVTNIDGYILNILYLSFWTLTLALVIIIIVNSLKLLDCLNLL